MDRKVKWTRKNYLAHRNGKVWFRNYLKTMLVIYLAPKSQTQPAHVYPPPRESRKDYMGADCFKRERGTEREATLISWGGA